MTDTPCLSTVAAIPELCWLQASAFPGCECKGCVHLRTHRVRWLPGCGCERCQRAHSQTARHTAAHELHGCRICGRAWWVGVPTERRDDCEPCRDALAALRAWEAARPVTRDKEAS